MSQCHGWVATKRVFFSVKRGVLRASLCASRDLRGPNQELFLYFTHFQFFSFWRYPLPRHFPFSSNHKKDTKTSKKPPPLKISLFLLEKIWKNWRKITKIERKLRILWRKNRENEIIITTGDYPSIISRGKNESGLNGRLRTWSGRRFLKNAELKIVNLTPN